CDVCAFERHTYFVPLPDCRIEIAFKRSFKSAHYCRRVEGAPIMVTIHSFAASGANTDNALEDIARQISESGAKVHFTFVFFGCSHNGAKIHAFLKDHFPDTAF